MTHQDSETTRLAEYIANVLPWAHGHQLKGITTFVGAIIEKQTGNQAELARGLGNQEAAVKRLSRLLHNERLAPHRLADAVLAQALRQVPPKGKVRLALDWTIEGNQHLLVVSLVTGGRAVPIYWRAYDATVLKGRMRRYEMAVIRRAVTRVQRAHWPAAGAGHRGPGLCRCGAGRRADGAGRGVHYPGQGQHQGLRPGPVAPAPHPGLCRAMPASAPWAAWPIVRAPPTGCG